jgi:hypothetical protein
MMSNFSSSGRAKSRAPLNKALSGQGDTREPIRGFGIFDPVNVRNRLLRLAGGETAETLLAERAVE